MAHATFQPILGKPSVVGSFGSAADLLEASATSVLQSCDIAEIRLDAMAADSGGVGPTPWQHLAEIPLLFTARRGDEGGVGNLEASQRIELLKCVLHQAAWIDLEVASIDEMGALITLLEELKIPWIASFHDFQKLPTTAVLEAAAKRAQQAGAAIFKTAAMLAGPADIARLAEFQLADHGIPVASMGMGPLAPVSRLLCAQCGSALNYGYIGKTATAPGQWDALTLKQAIAKLHSISC